MRGGVRGRVKEGRKEAGEGERRRNKHSHLRKGRRGGRESLWTHHVVVDADIVRHSVVGDVKHQDISHIDDEVLRV